MTHIMIDLETLDTKPTTVILSIGAVAFDPFTGDERGRFYEEIDAQGQIDQGRTVSADTLKWWMGQDNGVIKLEGERDLGHALHLLYEFFGLAECYETWGNGSTFDVSIMEDAYRSFNMEAPWKFWAVRDMRTIVALVGKEDWSGGTNHNALDDAIHQAGVVSRAYKKLGVTK